MKLYGCPDYFTLTNDELMGWKRDLSPSQWDYLMPRRPSGDSNAAKKWGNRWKQYPFHELCAHFIHPPYTITTINTNSKTTTTSTASSPVAPQRVVKLPATFGLFDRHKWPHCRWWCPPCNQLSSLWYSKKCRPFRSGKVLLEICGYFWEMIWTWGLWQASSDCFRWSEIDFSHLYLIIPNIPTWAQPASAISAESENRLGSSVWPGFRQRWSSSLHLTTPKNMSSNPLMCAYDPASCYVLP